MWRWTSGEIRANVLRETASPRTLAVLVDFVLMGFDVGGHGWPQYCVTRAVLHCLIHDSEFFGWLSSRGEKLAHGVCPPRQLGSDRGRL